MAKIGIIGIGNMGSAILKGLLHVYGKGDIIFTDVNEEKCEEITEETGVTHVGSNAECANQAKYIILAVKPQYFDPVLKNIRNVVTEANVIISIAPGITIGQLKEKLGIEKRVVRAMPNTPALVGEGMAAIAPAKNVTKEETEEITAIFNSFGKSEIVPEHLMDAVTAVSGSSPAYVYMMIEAMADAAVVEGMPRPQAYKFAAQAVLGSAQMVLETGKHPGELKDMVCSPGGTTIAAVAKLEESGFRSSIMQGMKACADKSREMSK